MKRILITGMSGTGKSTVVKELAARGFKAVDIDHPDWSEYREVTLTPGGPPVREWLWREGRVRDLLAAEDADVLFISGCAANQGQFYSGLDHVVLLSAPVDVMLRRLATRNTNSFGKSAEEREKILRDREEIEPLLRRRATLEIDTSAPLEEVVARLVALASEPQGSPARVTSPARGGTRRRRRPPG
ncbi:MAG TPA: AAA family ATPase [Dehalococcoidia bacterium]|nr:AAA family ATPase [Dehalococcoidia bacterium]